jgi:hypothetical protein
MKNIFIFLAVFAFLSGCKKTSINTIKNDDDNLLTNKVAYSYKDTTTVHIANNKIKVNSSAAVVSASISIDYVGNNNYKFSVVVSPDNLTGGWNLYRNGVLYENVGIFWQPFTFTSNLAPGTYVLKGDYNIDDKGYELTSPTINVIAKPEAPAGMLCLYRYFNSSSGQHICTYDWEELGCYSHGFMFEKVLGYTYPSASSAANLKPIYRYYKNTTGSHFTTDIQGNYAGFVYEKILGYVGTSATATLSRSLTKYYLSSTDDHFVCVPPDVPTYPGFTQDIDFIFGYVQ